MEITSKPYLSLYNAATGMIYLRARFYAPEMSRFSQKDILRGNVTSGISLNRYLYCGNDPVNYIDPSGMRQVENVNPNKDNVSKVIKTNNAANARYTETHTPTPASNPDAQRPTVKGNTNAPECNGKGVVYGVDIHALGAGDYGYGKDSSKSSDYLTKSIKGFILGNYSDNHTLLSALGSVALGITEFDIAADIRDLTYDLTHWGQEDHFMLSLSLDAIAFLPVIGSLKYSENLTDALKHTDKISDFANDIDDTVKTAGKITDFADDAKDAGKAFDDFDYKNANNKQKGNFGEYMADEDLLNNAELKKQGFDLERIGNSAPYSLDAQGHQGIDGLYKNKDPDSEIKYVIDEAKFGSSDLSKLKDGTRQMSDDWLLEINANRIKKAVNNDEELADDIIDAIRENQVAKVMSKVDEDGNVTKILLDAQGRKIGSWP